MSELARLAGVSVSTVSRALAGHTVVNGETRDRIVALAREHGFRPNLLARNLRLQRTGTIAVVLPLGHQADQHLNDPFFLTLIGNVADALSERGFAMLLRKVIPAGDDWLDEIVSAGASDGVMVIGQSNQHAAINRVATRYPPMVVWGAALPDQSYVTVGSDNVQGGTAAARHLVERGCGQLVFFGDPVVPEIALRERAFLEVVAAAGSAVRGETVSVGLVADEAHGEIAEFLATRPNIDGVVAASDVIALAAWRALSEAGLAVPGMVKVVGYDDVPVAASIAPGLTTIAQDLKRGAELLVDLLIRRIAGENVSSVTMDARLVVRGST